MGKATRQKSLLQETLALEQRFSGRRFRTLSLFSAQEEKEGHPEEQESKPWETQVTGLRPWPKMTHAEATRASVP